jgi:hypothetical protein
VYVFIHSVENVAKFKSWTSLETFNHAIASLVGSAAQRIKELPDLKRDWKDLKRVLLEMFGPHLSLDERLQTVSGLSQRKSESTDLFFARVDVELSRIESDVFKSAKSKVERDAMMK